MRLDKGLAAKAMFLVSCACMIFLYGVAVGFYKIFPYHLILYAYDSAWNLAVSWRSEIGLRPTEFLHPATHDGQGVTIDLAERAVPGLTFMSGFFEDGQEMRLIRLDGSIVRRWPVRFSTIWPEPHHIEPAELVPNSDWNTEIHGAWLMPDGSVVFNFEYHGMVKLDRCGNLQWKLDHMTHHSVEPASDGGFWVPGRRYVEADSAFPPISGPYHEDLVLKVSDDGVILDEISVPALLYSEDMRPLYLANGQKYIRLADNEMVHLNDVEELDAPRAALFAQFAAGDLLLSLRNLNLVMVIDPVTREVKWHQVGPWLRQHDPDFSATGTISVFDNNSDDTENGSIFGGSKIVDIDPRDGHLVSEYGGFFTNIRGKHQWLPGDHRLITEFQAGRVFEVNASGEIVWEYINRYDDDMVATVTEAIRYPESYFTVDGWEC
jgi:hypothetical protein